MADIEIKRGYEVLPDNNVRFGIRVINNSDFAISDVEVILDYSESLFDLEGNKIQKLDTIPPTVPRTAKFTLKPLGCIHKEEIAGNDTLQRPPVEAAHAGDAPQGGALRLPVPEGKSDYAGGFPLVSGFRILGGARHQF